ncbi:hypothetical protein D3C72_1070100 [compost metagenome]
MQQIQAGDARLEAPQREAQGRRGDLLEGLGRQAAAPVVDAGREQGQIGVTLEVVAHAGRFGQAVLGDEHLAALVGLEAQRARELGLDELVALVLGLFLPALRADLAPVEELLAEPAGDHHAGGQHDHAVPHVGVGELEVHQGAQAGVLGDVDRRQVQLGVAQGLLVDVGELLRDGGVEDRALLGVGVDGEVVDKRLLVAEERVLLGLGEDHLLQLVGGDARQADQAGDRPLAGEAQDDVAALDVRVFPELAKQLTEGLGVGDVPVLVDVWLGQVDLMVQIEADLAGLILAALDGLDAPGGDQQAHEWFDSQRRQSSKGCPCSGSCLDRRASCRDQSVNYAPIAFYIPVRAEFNANFTKRARVEALALARFQRLIRPECVSIVKCFLVLSCQPSRTGVGRSW